MYSEAIGYMNLSMVICCLFPVARFNWTTFLNDVEYLVLPLFHLYGMLKVFSVLDQGATIVLEKRFSIEKLGIAVEKYKVKLFLISTSFLISCWPKIYTLL